MTTIKPMWQTHHITRYVVIQLVSH